MEKKSLLNFYQKFLKKKFTLKNALIAIYVTGKMCVIKFGKMTII